MVDALINDGDIVVLKPQETCENGETVAVWLEEEKETTLKKFYHEGEPGSAAAGQRDDGTHLHRADNVRIQGKLVTVVRSID